MPNYDLNTPAFKNALADLRPVLDAIPSERLETIRVDLEVALVLALGVAPKAKVFQEEARTLLGESFATPFDRLVPAARACGAAHAQHLVSLNGAEVADMVATLGDKRTVLLLEATSLVNKKRMPGSLLGELAGGTGHRAMAFDVLQLTSAFRKEWAAVEAHTPVTQLELDQAEALANAVMTTLGENGQADSGSSPTAELRRRAYTHFVQTYSEVRRAITYLRWEEGDADEIAPSLFGGRTSRRTAQDADVIIPVITPTNGVPVSPGMPGAPPFVQS